MTAPAGVVSTAEQLPAVTTMTNLTSTNHNDIDTAAPADRVDSNYVTGCALGGSDRRVTD